MKTVLLFISTLLVTSSLSAQKFDLTFSSGVGINSDIKSLLPNTCILNGGPDSKTITANYSIKGIYNFKSWQAGISVDRRIATYRTYTAYPIIDYALPANMTTLQQYYSFMDWIGMQSYMNMEMAAYYPVKLLVNRKVTIKRIEAYAGLSAGYILFGGTRTIAPGEDRARTLIPFKKNSDCGTSIGFQAGASYSLTEHIGINTELAGDKMLFRQGPKSMLRSHANYINLGFRYRF